MDTDIQPLSFYHRAIFCVVNVSMSVREQELRFAPFCLPLINIILLIYSSSSSFFVPLSVFLFSLRSLCLAVPSLTLFTFHSPPPLGVLLSTQRTFEFAIAIPFPNGRIIHITHIRKGELQISS